MAGLDRILAPIKRKIFLIIGRAIVSAIDNTGDTQRVQLQLLAEEIASKVERFEEYGFSTYPFSGSQAVSVFINGDRAHGIILCVHDRRYRPTYLEEGEIVFYTDEDQGGDGHRVHFKRGRQIAIRGANIALGADIGEGRNLADDRLVAAFNNHIHLGGTLPVNPLYYISEPLHFTSKTEAV